MPTYEYECAKCRKEFELFQSMKDDALRTCPKDKCRMRTWGKGAVKRKLGVGAGFIFKGSGFYITDYRSEGYKSGAKNDAPKPAESSSSSSSASPSSSTSKTESAKPEPAKKAVTSPAKKE